MEKTLQPIKDPTWLSFVNLSWCRIQTKLSKLFLRVHTGYMLYLQGGNSLNKQDDSTRRLHEPGALEEKAEKLCVYLLHDPVDLAVLGVDLVAHVQSHVAQVANDATHLLQVLIHLVFPGIVCYPTIQKFTFISAVTSTAHIATAVVHISPLNLQRAETERRILFTVFLY